MTQEEFNNQQKKWDKQFYHLKQTTLIIVGIVFVVGSIFAVKPIYDHKRKMDKIMHNHQVHHQHFYNCNCRY
jgi:hypothetical protein